MKNVEFKSYNDYFYFTVCHVLIKTVVALKGVMGMQ